MIYLSNVIVILSVLLFSSIVFSQSYHISGQLSSWGTMNFEQPKSGALGIRYLPSITYSQALHKNFYLDINTTFHTYGSGLFHSDKDFELNHLLKFYRLWIRLSSSQFEVRIGLQKINFGSAVLLRPLMWFDRLDPRDPLQLTDGVYGALVRYYFLNNTNIWAWGLLGNSKTKGWELFGTSKKQPEFGGRLQVPFLKGEGGITFHHSRLNLSETQFVIYPSNEEISPENRIGIDGKWNIAIGFWLEAVLIQHKNLPVFPSYRKLFTTGADYTFGIGNGFYVVGEYFWQQYSEKIFKGGESIKFGAISANYPVSLLDRISAIIYCDWQNKNWYRFFSWQRTYDNLQVYLMGFWNPKNFQIYQNLQEQNLFSGKGFQIMVVLNH
jgi:hypothetical protein